MNQQVIKKARANQSGFTLIELIVVMVILGILAATALPRFINLGGDARVAALQGARGALTSSVALIHGQWLARGGSGTTVQIDGLTLTLDSAGYPTIGDRTKFITFAGISSGDYTIQPPSQAAGDYNPATDDNQFALIPKSVAGTAKGKTCNIIVSFPATAGSSPTVSDAPPASDC